MKLSIISYGILLFVSSCDKNYRVVPPLDKSKTQTIKLCTSGYSINVTTGFHLDSCTIGKEGQIEYSIYANSVADTGHFKAYNSIIIEIDQGQRLLDKIYNWGSLQEKVQSSIGKTTAVWKIFKTETGRFVGYTEAPKIWIEVSAQKIEQIDSLIMIASRLNGG